MFSVVMRMQRDVAEKEFARRGFMINQRAHQALRGLVRVSLSKSVDLPGLRLANSSSSINGVYIY